MSIIPGQKIVSPSAEELTDGCMCKVKGFENNIAKVVARGSKSEMNRKLDDIEGAEPPKKRPRLEGKENKRNPPKLKPPKRRPLNKEQTGRYCAAKSVAQQVCDIHV